MNKYNALNVVFVTLLSSLSMSISIFASYTDKGVYGTDDRKEPYQSSDNKIIRYAKATAAMVWNTQLTNASDLDTYLFPTTTLGEDEGLCSDQRFINQTHTAICSGFLIASDILVTAGHCIKSQKECSDISWVFDYTQKSTSFNKENVYKCKQLIASKRHLAASFDLSFTFNDYAIIKLDRKVTKRVPLKIRTKGTVKEETPLVMIGHPSGLPLKYVENAKVAGHWNSTETQSFIYRFTTFFRRSDYFTTTLDAFAGNSGSPVINQKTGKVEGILVMGNGDYTYDFQRKCSVVSKFEDTDEKAREIVFKITSIPGLEKLIMKDNSLN